MNKAEKKRLEIDLDTYITLTKIGKKEIAQRDIDNITPNVFASAGLKKVLREWSDSSRLDIDPAILDSIAIFESAGMGSKQEIVQEAIKQFVARNKERAIRSITEKLGTS